MSAAEIIEQIKTLPDIDRREVVEFVKRLPSTEVELPSSQRKSFADAANAVFSKHREALRKLAQ